MYTLTITNNYGQTIVAHPGDHKIDTGDQKAIDKLGNTYIEIPGLWNISFFDLGENMIEGYPLKETWGVLVRGANVEAYYRYEGGGQLAANIDQYGTCTLSTTNGSLIQIYLEELIIDETGIPTN